MKKYIKKADVLIEALPYLQSFKNKIFVIKYGGTALLNEEIRTLLLQDIVFLNTVGIKPVLVHGGSPLINRTIRGLGRQPSFINGVRVTDNEDIEIVVKVLEDLNKSIVSQLRELGGAAESLLSNHKVIKVKPAEKGLGHVGEIVNIQTFYINDLLQRNVIPIISPLTKSENDVLYNVNADSAASRIAVALKAVKLVLLTHVKGIMRDENNEETLIPSLYISEIEKLIKSKIIHGGMLPKVEAGCFTIKKGVNKVHIIDGNISHALLLEIFTNEGIGTQILRKSTNSY